MKLLYAILFYLLIFGLFILASCRKEQDCWTCMHADGRPLPLSPCQSKPVVIKQADGSILPVKCVKQ